MTKLKPLAVNVPRCAARFDFTENAEWCAKRNECMRFLSFNRLDEQAGIPHYSGISVMMGKEDCKDIIEVTE